MSRRANIVRHGANHKGRNANGSGGGSDPSVLNVDSTDNVGLDQGVRSINASGNETADLVLTALGDGGSIWAPALGGSTDSLLDFVRSHPCAVSFWPMNDTGPGMEDVLAGNELAENPTGSTAGQPVSNQGGYSFSYQQAGPSVASSGIQFDGDASGSSSLGTCLYRNNLADPIGSSFTIVGWAYNDTNPALRVPLSIWGGSIGGPQTTVAVGGFGLVTASGTFTAVASGSVAASAWRFLSATCNSSTNEIKFYLDGVLQQTTSFTGTPVSDGYWRFGCQGTGSSGPTNFFKGRLSQWAAFDCVLDASEIAVMAALTGAPLTAGLVPVTDGAGSWEWGDHGDLAGLADDDHTQYVRKATLTTKGDLYAATGAGTVVRVGVGTDGQRLTARASATPGVAWEDASSFDPSTAMEWWFPLVDSDGTVVLDSDGNLIPTLIPL